MKMSGYLVFWNKDSRMSSWALVKVVLSLRCFRGLEAEDIYMSKIINCRCYSAEIQIIDVQHFLIIRLLNSETIIFVILNVNKISLQCGYNNEVIFRRLGY